MSVLLMSSAAACGHYLLVRPGLRRPAMLTSSDSDTSECARHTRISTTTFTELLDSPAEPVCIAAGRSPENKNEIFVKY
jgi:hypothetical protein